jgi:uncharacterized protein (TIGR01244 family)
MRLPGCYLIVILLGFPLLGQDRHEAVGQNNVSAVNFVRLNAEVCLSGQPSVEDLERLREQGVRTILNLRRPEEDPEGQGLERKRAQEMGFKYLVIPIDAANITTSQVEEFFRAVRAEENRPLLIHCRTAARVGALWWIHRVLNDGWNCAKAEQEARRIGLSQQALIDFARGYIEASKPLACTASR